jgi:hypothetical protein
MPLSNLPANLRCQRGREIVGGALVKRLMSENHSVPK